MKASGLLEKNIEVSLLFDFYGQLLKPQQQRAVELYYNEDLSLSEIALELNITRQGVRDCVKRGEAQLYLYEEKLGLYRRFGQTQQGLTEIERLAKGIVGGCDSETAEIIEKIIETAAALREQR